MRILLVVAALAVAVPATAAAQRLGESHFSGGSGARGGDRDRARDRIDVARPDRDDRRDRRRGGGYIYDYASADDRVGDRAWQPDSFNDWWHDFPSRAYPAWVARNTKCERLWWSGAGWRC